MSTRSIQLIVDADLPLDAAEASAKEAMAHWPGDDPPEVRPISINQAMAQPEKLHSRVAWLMLGEASGWMVHEMAGLLEERHIPILLQGGGSAGEDERDSSDSIVVCPAGEQPTVVAAVLYTLWRQSAVIRHLTAELRVLQAHQGGLVDQIDKIDEELRLAAQLQREFLPTGLPQMGGVSFEALWRPAGYVSGDIYDVLRLDENHLGLFIADAVGHGVPAALMTMYIKRSLRLKQIDADAPRGYRLLEPGEALAKLNADMVARQTGKVRFATACYAVINVRTRELRIARAGHPLPMLLRGDGTTEMLEPDGGLLGVFEEEEFPSLSVQLCDGDRLLIYSDGFEVAFPELSPQSADGTRRVANDAYTEELAQLRHGSMKDALNRLTAKIDRQAGSLNQRDDLTVLCMSVEPEAAAQADDARASAA